MRERHGEFGARGARLILVVCQAPAAVRAYCERHPLPFPVGIDATRDAARAWGVWRMLGLDAVNIARPVTFVVDRGGIVRRSLAAPVQWKRPPIDVILKELEAIGPATAPVSGPVADR